MVAVSFKDQPYSSRYLVMGDIAEAAFLRRFPEAVRTGLNRAKTTRGLTEFQRYEPDFRLFPDSIHRFEVMGIGRDQKLKLKVEKAFALCQWSAVEEVDLYVWDQHKKRDIWGPIDQWIDVLFRHGVYAYFPPDNPDDENGKPYIELRAKDFPYEWQQAEAA